MVKKKMKKLFSKKMLTTALIVVMGFMSLVAMMPRENFPELGIDPNPPVVDDRCEGCPFPLK